MAAGKKVDFCPYCRGSNIESYETGYWCPDCRMPFSTEDYELALEEMESGENSFIYGDEEDYVESMH